MTIKRAVATLMTLAVLTAGFVVGPTPQVSSGGEVSIGYAAAEASHQPCRPTHWVTRKPTARSTQAVRTRVVLRNQRVLPGGAWVQCHYDRYSFGIVLMPQPSYVRTVPHR